MQVHRNNWACHPGCVAALGVLSFSFWYQGLRTARALTFDGRKRVAGCARCTDGWYQGLLDRFAASLGGLPGSDA